MNSPNNDFAWFADPFAETNRDIRQKWLAAEEADRRETRGLGGSRVSSAAIHVSDAALAILPDEPHLHEQLAAHYERMAADERGARILELGRGLWDDRPTAGVVFTTTVRDYGQNVSTHVWSESERAMDWPETEAVFSLGELAEISRVMGGLHPRKRRRFR